MLFKKHTIYAWRIYGSTAQGGDISLRGFGSTNVLVLVDGVLDR